jgi:deoxyadenosine/deoxycytidine kinase
LYFLLLKIKEFKSNGSENTNFADSSIFFWIEYLLKVFGNIKQTIFDSFKDLLRNSNANFALLPNGGLPKIILFLLNSILVFK